jgi:hypothetical protein
LIGDDHKANKIMAVARQQSANYKRGMVFSTNSEQQKRGTMEELLGMVFSVQSVLRLYNKE